MCRFASSRWPNRKKRTNDKAISWAFGLGEGIKTKGKVTDMSMDISRRQFVKRTAIAMATAAAAGSVAGMAGCAPKVNEPINGDATTKTLAVCRFCGCGSCA